MYLREDWEADSRTFGELERRVCGLAAWLRSHAAPGDRALLLYPAGLEFIEAFLGCLAAGVIAVPAPPPCRNHKRDRLHGILNDCGPRLVLTTASELPKVGAAFLHGVGPAAVLATDGREVQGTGPFPCPHAHPDVVAFLQYTSGSTGAPKGVAITHRNIVGNAACIQHSSGHDTSSVMACWLPLFHDFGLVGGVLQPLFVGFPSILFSPAGFLRDPARWLRILTEYRVTSAGAPNFAYDLCVRHVTEEQKRTLDLSRLKTLKNGAEPVRGETLDRFARAFAGCGFRPRVFEPCYGLAEATLFVTGGLREGGPRRLWVDADALEHDEVVAAPADAPGTRCLVSCGRPGRGTRLVVVDEATRGELPPERIGEVWVQSSGVGRGYWNRLAETRDTFHNHLAGGDGPFLRTGDLGFLDGGELFLTGRRKDLIIYRGRNLYPQDIEAALDRLVPLAQRNACAAFGVEVDGGEWLALVLEADRALVRAVRAASSARQGPAEAESDLKALVRRVREAVEEQFRAPVHSVTFVRPGTFPRTSSGKVQRRACRVGLQRGALDVVYHWQAAEEATNQPAPAGR
jgi:acyl-CoA synthetase (AMP-forming)/AMP-acid ligase II